MARRKASSLNKQNMIVWFTLVLQTTATVLTIRYSRLKDPNDDHSIPSYATSTTVATSEFCKVAHPSLSLSPSPSRMMCNAKQTNKDVGRNNSSNI